jgi:prenylcysteine oxidase/farnesylcysteine lyase
VYPHGDERLRAQEVGASIFVEANRHLVKAAKVRLLTS